MKMQIFCAVVVLFAFTVSEGNATTGRVGCYIPKSLTPTLVGSLPPPASLSMSKEELKKDCGKEFSECRANDDRPICSPAAIH